MHCLIELSVYRVKFSFRPMAGGGLRKGSAWLDWLGVYALIVWGTPR